MSTRDPRTHLHPTPEAAAREGRPEHDFLTLGLSLSPDRGLAVVLLGVCRTDPLHVYETLVARERAGWVPAGFSPEPEWTVLSGPDEEQRGVLTRWGPAPEAARFASWVAGGHTHTVPIERGYYFLALWDVPEQLDHELSFGGYT